MDENDKYKVAVDAMVAEAGRLGDSIAERLAAAERFVAVAGALAGVGLTLGLFQKQTGVLIALPVAISVIYLFMIQIYTDASMHSGHRRALEERLHALLGQVALVGQSKVASGYARRLSIPLTFILIMTVWVLTAVAGLWATLHVTDSLSDPWKPVSIGLYVAILLLRHHHNLHWHAGEHDGRGTGI